MNASRASAMASGSGSDPPLSLTTLPARLRSTGQALFGAVVFGGGNALGYQLSGLGYDHYRSVAPLYAWAAALEILPLAAVLAFRFGRPAPRPGRDGL